MESLYGQDLCFPQLLNTSCRKSLHHGNQTIFLYILLSCISLLTVTLNLLVIVSISHFRQLHSQTNFILLSLAVSDFLVGLLLMPPRILLLGGCWFWGNFICGVFYYASFILTSASVGHMVLISLDRYVAICDPLCYPTIVTQRRVQIFVCLCWACSLLYNGMILNSFLKQPDRYNSCHGECIVVINFVTGASDIVITFIGPIAVIIFLYMKVFVVAVSQARAMRSQIAFVSSRASVHVTIKKSERKAATTIGVIVVVFLICFCPYFYPSLVGQDTSTSVEFSVFGVWLLYCNSCLNPLIYAFFYPWFRRTVKLIVTLQILQPDSCYANILSPSCCFAGVDFGWSSRSHYIDDQVVDTRGEGRHQADGVLLGLWKQSLGMRGMTPNTGSEVTEVVKQLLDSRAPLVDEIHHEFLKALDGVGLSCLTHLCKVVWKHEAVPLD
ncbi:trace amine-associated receptor 13c-like [Archocentrus centrarchus]|uniref:trace amine-associated receptor 13c-like n=1 Tax=Archocentrus centrarchus TaxID=63155 RepID=UPI0011EA24BF|nr:trace amine-associated receptor 13c-like [Archocentrus centrarchus]